MRLRLTTIPGAFAVSRLAADAPIPAWAAGAPAPLCSVTRTAQELSVVCAAELVPAGTQTEAPWAAMAIDGPLDFALTGVVAALTAPLAEADVPVFVVSTYDTDVLLVKEADGDRALETLAAAGHSVD